MKTAHFLPNSEACKPTPEFLGGGDAERKYAEELQTETIPHATAGTAGIFTGLCWKTTNYLEIHEMKTLYMKWELGPLKTEELVILQYQYKSFHRRDVTEQDAEKAHPARQTSDNQMRTEYREQHEHRDNEADTTVFQWLNLADQVTVALAEGYLKKFYSRHTPYCQGCYII